MTIPGLIPDQGSARESFLAVTRRDGAEQTTSFTLFPGHSTWLFPLILQLFLASPLFTMVHSPPR